MQTIRLSVSQLLDFARSGNLVRGQIQPRVQAKDGIRIHQFIQKQRDPSWYSEVSVTTQVIKSCRKIIVQGRIDLVKPADMVSPIIIEEIKTLQLKSDSVSDAKLSLFWAQAKIYAYLLSQDSQWQSDSYILRLNLYSMSDQRSTIIEKEISLSEAGTFFETVLDRYLKWSALVEEHREDSRKTILDLKFPFEQFRDNQRYFSRFVYQNFRNKQSCLVEAPTGIGKTQSVLFPAIKFLTDASVEKVCQIYYLTFRNSCQKSAIDAYNTLRLNSGLKASLLQLQAREKLCPCLNGDIDEESCCRLEGFYDRLYPAMHAALGLECLDANTLCALAEQFTLCPHELALELKPWVDIVVGDINYILTLNQEVKLETSADKNERLFLVDEAHNLPERIRQAHLIKFLPKEISVAEHFLRKQRKFFKESFRLVSSLLNFLEKLTDDLAAFKQPMPSSRSEVQIVKNPTTLHLGDQNPAGQNLDGRSIDKIFQTLLSEVTQFSEAFYTTYFSELGLYLNANTRAVNGVSLVANDSQSLVLDILLALYRYCEIILFYREIKPSGIMLTIESSGVVLIECADTNAVSAFYLKRARSVAAFSATLSPLDFYAHQIGFGSESDVLGDSAMVDSITSNNILEATENTTDELGIDIHRVILQQTPKKIAFSASLSHAPNVEKLSSINLRLPSVFPSENQLVLISRYLDLSWNNRDKVIDDVVDLIISVISHKPGNYLVFAASFDQLDKVYDSFIDRELNISSVKQSRSDSQAARETLFAMFEPDNQMLGFVVLGGYFAEALDFYGDKLHGVIILGTGAPVPSEGLTRQSMWLNEAGYDGFATTFIYPGVTKILQAAGRVIRTETDRGVVVLADSRFSQQPYLGLLPGHWQSRTCSNLDDICSHLRSFWCAD